MKKNLVGWHCEMLIKDGKELPCFTVARDGQVICEMEDALRTYYAEKIQQLFLEKFPF